MEGRNLDESIWTHLVPCKATSVQQWKIEAKSLGEEDPVTRCKHCSPRQSYLTALGLGFAK